MAVLGPRKNRHGVVEWGIDVLSAGRGSKRRQFWGYASQAEAEAALRQHFLLKQQQKHGLTPLGAPPLSELFEKHANTIENPKERQKARRVYRDFLALFPVRFTTADLTSADIDRYTEMRGETVSAGTVRRELTILSAALHAAPRYYRELQQWIAPKIFYPKNSRRRRERIIEPDEIQQLTEWFFRPKLTEEALAFYLARKRTGLVFLTALLTAARIGEIARLRWSDVKWSRNVLEIIGTKTQFSKDTVKARQIELTEPLRWVLAQRKLDKKRESDFIFFDGGNVTPKYYAMLKTACEACGIAYGRFAENGLTTHHTRHTAVTRMLEQGLDLGTVMNVTGSSATFVLWYSQKTDSGRKKAGEALANVADLQSLMRE